MPVIDPAFTKALSELTIPELERRRAAILEKAKGDHTALSEDDLTELSAIYNAMRGQASPTPKTRAGKKSGPTTDDDLLSAF